MAIRLFRSKRRIRPGLRLSALWLTRVAGLVTVASCGAGSVPGQGVEAKYDKGSGRLSQLTLDSDKDGKTNIISYMDGTRVIRIEIDNDQDGRIDKWEYYGADQKLQKVGLSRLNDGKPDVWFFPDEGGLPLKAEVSTRRDGTVNRTEFYSKGELARAEEDTDADGRVDRWETYAGGVLAAVAFDTTRSGKPTLTVDYRHEK